jgi:putative copper resistance protein D
METALSLARFLHYSAAIQLFGTAVFETWIAPKPLSDSLLQTSRRIALFNAWLLLISAIAWLGLAAGSMGDGWADTLDLEVITLVLSSTSFGHAWMVNLPLSVLAVGIAYALGPRRHAALALCATLKLAALAFVGHAMTLSGGLGLLSQLSQVVHLISSGFWFGSLLSVVVLLRQIGDVRYAGHADLALRRFSGLGHAAVALALSSGIANSWFVLRDVPLSFGSTYQLLLALKVGLVGSMCLIAIVNRYIFMPRIPQGSTGAQQLCDGTVAELVIGTIVIAIVSLLGILPPD